MVDVAPATVHPLDALVADEIRAAVSVVRESGRVDDGVLFAMVTLDEPGRAVVAAHRPGDPVDRRVRLILLPAPEAAVVEAVVSLASGTIVEWTPRDGVRPALLFDDISGHQRGFRIFTNATTNVQAWQLNGNRQIAVTSDVGSFVWSLNAATSRSRRSGGVSCTRRIRLVMRCAAANPPTARTACSRSIV